MHHTELEVPKLILLVMTQVHAAVYQLPQGFHGYFNRASKSHWQECHYLGEKWEMCVWEVPDISAAQSSGVFSVTSVSRWQACQQRQDQRECHNSGHAPVVLLKQCVSGEVFMFSISYQGCPQIATFLHLNIFNVYTAVFKFEPQHDILVTWVTWAILFKFHILKIPLTLTLKG